MWTKIKAFFWQDFEKAFGRKLSPVERWSLRNAKTCSADEIIAASIIQSFAKSFEDWSFKAKPQPVGYRCANCTEIEKERREFVAQYAHGNVRLNRVFVNKSKDIIFAYWLQDNKTRTAFYVNGLSFPTELGQLIVAEFEKLDMAHQKAVAAAAKAKADMERNEKAWNLAERLLGMRRNEFGALVPIQTAE